LESALENAEANTTINLAPGEYGDLALSSLDLPENVSIVGGGEASFNTIRLSHVNNLSFDGVDIAFTPDEDTYSFSTAFRGYYSNNISFTDGSVVGGPAVNGVPIDTPPGELDETGNVLGLPTGTAFNLYNCEGFTLEDSEIASFKRGISLSNSDYFTMTGNEVYNLRTTPLGGGSVDHITVTGNYFHDSTPWALGGQRDHADMIHLWTSPGNEAPSTDILIQDNIFMQGDGAAIFGILIEDNSGLGFTDVVIDNNILHNGSSQGFYLENVQSGSVTNNTMLQTGGGETDAPNIQLKLGTSNIEILNNIMGPLVSDISEEEQSRNLVENNLVVQRQDSSSPNYYGDLFVEALKPGATLEDIQAIPDGVIAEMGVGSSLSTFNANPEELTALIHSETVERDGNEIRFDASLTANEDGFVAEGATFEWDFGDGFTSEGIEFTHAYKEPGEYVVSLTVTLPDGTVDRSTTQVTVYDPNVLNVSFDSVLSGDADGFAGTWTGEESLVVENGNTAASFDPNKDSLLYFETNSSLGGLPNFTLSFDMKSDDIPDEGHQRPVWLHGNYGMRIEADGDAKFFLWQENGNVAVIDVPNPGLLDSEWHNVAMTYSAEEGKATVYVDGVEVGGVDGLEGDIAQVFSSKLYVGGVPWGGRYGGEIDNLSIRGEVVDPSVVEEVDPVIDPIFSDDFELFLGGVQDVKESGYVDYGKSASYSGSSADDDEFSAFIDFRIEEGGASRQRILWNHTEYGIEKVNDDLVFCFFDENNNSVRATVKDVDVEDGNWHTVGFSLNEKTGDVRCYLDGEVVQELTGSDVALTEDISRLTAGGTAWGREINGEVDNLRLYDDVVAPVEESLDLATFALDELL
jgi:parallel beta-helix repeat protein